ncbi:hypothetical protein Hanom_Chr03g00270991 [Helianthus anomalus]
MTVWWRYQATSAAIASLWPHRLTPPKSIRGRYSWLAKMVTPRLKGSGEAH